MGDGRDELDDTTILKAINEAYLAGECWIEIRQTPEAKRGLTKMGRKHSTAATALLKEFLARQGVNPAGPSPSRDSQGRPDSRTET